MTVAVGAGLALSDVLGGTVLAVGGSVRVVLWIIGGASLALLAVVWLLVEDVPTRTRVRVDVAGAALLATGLAALVAGIGHGNGWGWGSSRVIALLIIAVLLLISWGAWELHSPRPLIDLRIARRRDVWPAYALVAVISTMGIILALAVSEYVQTPSAVGYGFGGSVLTAGLYLVPGGLMAAAGGAVAAPVLSGFGQRATALAGGLLATVSFLWFQSTTSRPWEFVVLTALSGVSYALVYTAGSSAYLRAARPEKPGCWPAALASPARQSPRPGPWCWSRSSPVRSFRIRRSLNTATTGTSGSSSRALEQRSVRSLRSYANHASTSDWPTTPRSCDCPSRVGQCSPTGSRDARCRLTRSPSARPRARPPDR